MSETVTKIGRINLNQHTNVYYALTKIKGISYTLSAKLCEIYKIDKCLKISEVPYDALEQLNLILDANELTINNKTYPLYKNVYFVKKRNIEQKIQLNTEEGLNHSKGYRVHGQKRK
jgi:ribosomal protein S13